MNRFDKKKLGRRASWLAHYFRTQAPITARAITFNGSNNTWRATDAPTDRSALNITWWDANRRHVVSWAGPYGRHFAPAPQLTSSPTPSADYGVQQDPGYRYISPTGDFYVQQRWSSNIYLDGVPHTAPSGDVVAAAYRETDDARYLYAITIQATISYATTIMHTLRRKNLGLGTWATVGTWTQPANIGYPDTGWFIDSSCTSAKAFFRQFAKEADIEGGETITGSYILVYREYTADLSNMSVVENDQHYFTQTHTETKISDGMGGNDITKTDDIDQTVKIAADYNEDIEVYAAIYRFYDMDESFHTDSNDFIDTLERSAIQKKNFIISLSQLNERTLVLYDVMNFVSRSDYYNEEFSGETISEETNFWLDIRARNALHEITVRTLRSRTEYDPSPPGFVTAYDDFDDDYQMVLTSGVELKNTLSTTYEVFGPDIVGDPSVGNATNGTTDYAVSPIVYHANHGFFKSPFVGDWSTDFFENVLIGLKEGDTNYLTYASSPESAFAIDSGSDVFPVDFV